MPKSAKDASTSSTGFTRSGKIGWLRGWDLMFIVHVRVDHNGVYHHTRVGNDKLLDHYYGPVKYKLRVKPIEIPYVPYVFR